MKKKNNYLAIGAGGIGAILFGLGILCWKTNEQWKRDCAEAERYRNLMHDISDPIIDACSNYMATKQVIDQTKQEIDRLLRKEQP